MKKLLFIAFAFLSISSSAQNYGDSTITLQLPKVAAWYIGYHIKSLSGNDMWNNRTAPSTLKNYVGSGANYNPDSHNPDSLFTVTLKASYIKGMIELLLSGGNEETLSDRLSILNNSPAIPSYTSLIIQVTAIANGSGAQKNAAIFIRDYYLQRQADFEASRREKITNVIKWANN
jgi:hypothetical protein